MATLEEQLLSAVREGRVEEVQTLLAQGPSNQYVDLFLREASERGYTEVVKVLLSRGADVNAVNRWNETALREASVKGHLEVVKVLLAHGADVNVVNEWNITALMCASERGHPEVVKVLLAHGRPPSERLCEGPVEDSATLGTKCLRLRRLGEADVNAVSRRNETALMHASEEGHLEVVKVLLAHGADVNVVNRWNETALMHASKEGHLEVVKEIILHKHIIREHHRDLERSQV